VSVIIGLILAAGSSKRLGRPKALVQLPSGDTLLARAVRVALEAGSIANVTVSLDAADVRTEAERSGASVVLVPDAARGMSASLRCGAAVAQARGADAILVLLVDQWQVQSSDLTRLLSAWGDDPSRIIASAYADTVGAPAVFGKRHFDQLARLEGDAGARDFLRDPLNGVRSIDLPNAAVDLDSIADLGVALPKV
jgi:CTP:molybdopterin cytidylyltransferase MocA